MADPLETAPEVPPTRATGWVPWSLLVVLGLYGLAVFGYVWKVHWSSPEYQSAVHLREARALLGPDDGRKATRANLELAMTHLLEAARLTPEVRFLHDRVESIRWRFEERAFELPLELKNRAEAVSALYRRIQEQRASIGLVGVRERGWAMDQVLEGPERAVKWSMPGAGLVVLLWVYARARAPAALRKQKSP